MISAGRQSQAQTGGRQELLCEAHEMDGSGDHRRTPDDATPKQPAGLSACACNSHRAGQRMVHRWGL